MGYTGMQCSAIEHFEKDNTLYEKTGKIGYSNRADIAKGDILILYGAIGLSENVGIVQNKAVSGRVLGYCKCISKMKTEPLPLKSTLASLQKEVKWNCHIEVENLSPNFTKKSRDKTILDINYYVSDALGRIVSGHAELKETEAERLIEAIKKYDQ
jgi:hypothetical protein